MPRRRKGADEQVDALFPTAPENGPDPVVEADFTGAPEPEREAREDPPAPVELGEEFWTGIRAANALRAEDEP
jgi:hypothetical protein